MAAVEMDKQFYVFYHAPHQSNAEYLEVLKARLKVIESHISIVGYHPGPSTSTLLEKRNITSKNANK